MAGSCSIHRGSDGRISRVETPEGKRSKLFDALASIPVMENRERAASFFKKVFAPKFKRLFGDWEKGVPRNRAAYEKIRRKLRGFPENERRAALQYAASLDNPIMVRRSNPGYETQELGQSYYSEESGEGEWYIIDAMSNGNFDMSRSVPADRAEQEYAPAFLAIQPSPVNRFVTQDGETYWSVARGILAKPVSTIEEESLDGLTYDTGEPRLFFLTDDGRVFDDYGDALSHTSGTVIRAGFVTGSAAGMLSGIDEVYSRDGARLASEDGFLTVMEIPTSSNPFTRNGLINYLIRKGFLSGRRVFDPESGSYRLVGVGNTPSRRVFGSMLAYGELLHWVLPYNVSIDDRGLITLRNFDPDRIPMVGRDGRRSTLSREEIKQMLRDGRYEELRRKYAYTEPLIASLLFEDASIYEGNRDYDGSAEGADMRQKNEIVSILRSLGIRVMGMSDYLEKYALKNGVEPDAKALADIANGVIALAEDASIEDLQEEVAHFLVEAYQDQAAVSEAMEGVRETEEWDRYASEYYRVYGKEFSGEALDRAVEREILGKILARAFRRPARVSQESGFFSRVRNLLSSMRNFFRSRLDGQREALNRVVENIRESALSGRVSAFDTSQLKGNPYTLYSLSDVSTRRFLDSRIRELRRTLNALRRLYNEQAGMGVGMSAAANVTMESLKALEADIASAEREVDKADVLKAVSGLVNTAEAMSEYAKRMVRDFLDRKGEEGYSVRPSDRVAVDVLYDQVLPMLNSMRSFIAKNLRKNEGVNERAEKELQRKIDHIVSDINSIRSDAESAFLEDRDTLMRSLMTKFGVSENDQSRIIQMIDRVQKDISIVARWFGILEHSGNLIDGALGRLISENYYRSMAKTEDDVRAFLRVVESGKWDRKRFEGLIKNGVNGKKSRWLMGPIDMARYEHDLKTEQMKALRDILKDSDFAKMSDQEIEDFINRDRIGTFKVTAEDDAGRKVVKTVRFKPTIDRTSVPFLSIADELAYKERIRQWKAENDEDIYTAEYRLELESINKAAEEALGRALHPESLSLLRAISRQKFLLKNDPSFYDNPATRKGYHPERFFASPNAAQYMRLNAALQDAASDTYTIGGAVLNKTGVELERAQDIAAVLKARRDFYKKKASKVRVSDSIYDAIRRIQRDKGAKAAYDFLLYSGRLSFSDSFYDAAGLGEDETGRALNHETLAENIKAKMLRRNPDANTSEVDRLSESISDAKRVIKDILARYKDGSNLGNILVDDIADYDMDLYKKSVSDMESGMRKLKALAEKYKVEVKYPSSNVSESGVTDDYVQHVQGMTKAQEVEFQMKHMTEAKKGFLKAFRNKLAGKIPNAKYGEMERTFLAEQFGIDGTLSPEDFNAAAEEHLKEARKFIDVDSYTAMFGRNLIYSYFKRFAPKGYTRFMEEINSENPSVDVAGFARDLINGRRVPDYGFPLEHLSYRPDDAWVAEELDDKNVYNPNYAPDTEYGSHHPRMDRYRDEEYYSHFGIREDGRPTSNMEEWEMLEMLKGLNRTAYEAYGVTSRSVYAIPQVSQHTLERMQDVGSGNLREVFRNWARDTITDTVDESIYGQTDLNEQVEDVDKVRAIPKYYLNEIEDGDNVSHDLAYSFSLLIQSANLYREKAATYSAMMGLEQALLRQQFEGGRKAEATNAYGLFKAMVDNYWYGIKSNTGRVTFNLFGFSIDVTRMAFAAERYMSTMNLAFSPAVAATGAVTGYGTLGLEAAVGQYVDRKALSYAHKELSKNFGSYASEIGDLDRKSKIYVVGERLGLYSFRNRVYGAGYSRAARVMTRDVCYKALEAATAPLVPLTMVSVLDGARYYRGRDGRGRFYTKSQLYDLLSQEGNAEGFDSLWDSLQNRNLWAMMDVQDGVIRPAEGSGLAIEDIEQGLSLQRNKARSLMNIVDGTLNEEQQIAARRNFILRFLTAHRGWMTLAGQRLFKRYGYNFMTNQFEEGITSSIYRFLDTVYKNGREQGFSHLAKVLQSAYATLSPEAKTNFRRMVGHMAFWGFGVVLAQMMMGISGDDGAEDEWAVQFATYITMRSINEVSSMMLLPYLANLVDVANDPFVNARKIQDLVNPSNWSLARVTSGSYKGETKLFRLFARQTFIKQWYTYKTADDVRRAFEWWLQTNSHIMWMYGVSR